MQFLVLNRRRAEAYSEADVAPNAQDDAQRIRQMYADASVRQIWHLGDVPCACLLVEAENAAQVRSPPCRSSGPA